MLFRTRFICLVIMAAVSAGSAASVANCARSYVVKEGDTCDSVCGSQSASTYQLKRINGDTICNNIYLKAGQTLCLGIKRQDCVHTHVVKPNDNCDSIAMAFGIDTSTLLSNNPNIIDDCSNIYIKEVVCVDRVLIGYS